MTDNSSGPQSRFSGLTIFYGIMSVVLGFIAAYAMDASQFGKVAKLFGFILGSVLAFVGVYIGDLLRKAVHPDVIFSSGMTDMLKQKIFWLIGPQFIGGAIGAFVGAAIIGVIAK